MREINHAKQESSAQSVVKLIRSQVNRPKPLLVVLCGPSHAGKTTFARSLGKPFRVVSTDEIRKDLGTCFKRCEYETGIWKAFEAKKRQALKKEYNVVLDACHMSRKARWHSLQGPNGHYTKICVVFDLPLQAVRARCQRAKRVPLTEVERMWMAFQISRPTTKGLKLQGFDVVYFVKE